MSVPGFVIVSDDETGDNSTIHTAVTDKSGIQKLVTLSEVSSLQDELPTGEETAEGAVKVLGDGERLHYQCSLCVKTFLSLKSLTRHKKKAHPDAPDGEELTVILSPSTKHRVSGMVSHAQPNVPMLAIKQFMAKTPLKPDLLVKDQYLAAELAAELQQLEAKHARKRPRYNCKKEHKCNICGKNFATPSLLRRHHVVHTGEKPYHCHLCEKKYSQIERLKRHMGTHTGENIFTCKACGKRFEEKCRYIDHVRSHIDEKPYECEVCGKIFTNRVGLWKHKSVHDEKKVMSEYESMSFRFQCDICMKHFKLEKELIRHTRTHTGEAPEKPYNCQYCNKPFSRKILMVTHERSHTGERPFKCQYCLKTFACQRTMANHVKLHVLAAIGTSNKTDSNLPETTAPANDTESQLQLDCETVNLFQQKSTPFRCEVCFQYFQRKSSLSSHYKAQHENVQTVEFRCCHCGLRFNSLEAVTAHTENVHENLDKSAQFRCIVCSQLFQSKESLSFHYEANHENVNPVEFKCCQCGLLFDSMEAVTLHTQTVHGTPTHNASLNVTVIQDMTGVPAVSSTTLAQHREGISCTSGNINGLHQGQSQSASMNVDMRGQTYPGMNFNQGHVPAGVATAKSAFPPPEMNALQMQMSTGDYMQTNQMPVDRSQAGDSSNVPQTYSNIQQGHAAMQADSTVSANASNWHVGSNVPQVGYTAEKAGMITNMTNWPSGTVVEEHSRSMAQSWIPDFSTMQQIENLTSVHQVTQWANSVEEMASEEVFSTTVSNVDDGSGHTGIIAPPCDQIVICLKNSLKASQTEDGPIVPDRSNTFAPVSLLEEYMPPRKTRRKSI